MLIFQHSSTLKPTQRVYKILRRWFLFLNLVLLCACHQKKVNREQVSFDGPIPITSSTPRDTIRKSLNYPGHFSFANGILNSRGVLKGTFELNWGVKEFKVLKWFARGDTMPPGWRPPINHLKTDFRKGIVRNTMAPPADFLPIIVYQNRRDMIKGLNLEYLEHIELDGNGQDQPVTGKIVANANSYECKFVSFDRCNVQLSTYNEHAEKSYFFNCNFLNSCLSGESRTIKVFDGKWKGAKIKAVGKIYLEKPTLDSVNTLDLSDTCKLSHLHGNGTLELLLNENAGNDCPVVLNDVNLDHLVFADFGINFIVDTAQQFFLQRKLLKQLVQRYADVPERKEKYDLQLQHLMDEHEHHWFTAFLNANWNNYGYNKFLIFRNAMVLMLLCYMINLRLYPNILIKGYEIDDLLQIEQPPFVHSEKKRRRLRYFYCLLYTALIFWGIKLNQDKLKASHIGLTSWILFQYVLGLVCLAYIANIVITTR